MNNHVLIYEDGRVALTTRDYMHLSVLDPIWKRYAEDVRLLWDIDYLLNMRLAGLSWVDLNQIGDEFRKDNLLIQRFAEEGRNIYVFHLIADGEKGKMITPVAYCYADNGMLRQLSGEKVVFRPGEIISAWHDCYDKAVLESTEFEANTWMYYVWMVINDLRFQGRSYDAHEVLKCAIARAEKEGRSDATGKFQKIEEVLFLNN